ncbi:hypothetical protein F7R23_18035 [Burkholderia diffusa]|nr:hypothetical protein F7R23_18035 [Burkholderia diffusa]
MPLTVAVGRSAGCPMRRAVRRPGCLAVPRPRRDRSRSSPTAGRPLLSATRPPARWSKRIRSTGPTCEKSACLHFPRQIAALKHLHTIDPKRTIRRQA